MSSEFVACNNCGGRNEREKAASRGYCYNCSFPMGVTRSV